MAAMERSEDRSFEVDRSECGHEVSRSVDSATQSTREQSIAPSVSCVRECIQGNESEMSRYVGLRTFALSSLPSWLSNRCHEIAREHFRAGTSGVDVREVMEFSLIKFEADPISRWIVKDLHHAKPALVRKHIKKELLRMADMIDPKFSEKRFQELGIPEAGVLSDLLSPRGEANSLESPQAFKPSTTELHRCIKESCFGEDSLEQLCEQMISFNPLRKGEMAVHANRAYTASEKR